ncbi:MAG: hypothetical protein N4A45_12885 [Flavobacteriales bacterium]|jgi:hypothetical protein|nr:hypothetical protein [Flavobacteriales bacterium]
MKVNKFLLLTVLFLFEAVSVHSQAISCREAGIDENTEGAMTMLRIYFQAEDGRGGRGCWAHPHENGKDIIVTPKSWGKNPNPGKQSLINKAMESVTETRTWLQGKGGVQKNMIITLRDDDPYIDGEEIAVTNDFSSDSLCYIMVEASKLRPFSWRKKQFIFTHEICHCFNRDYFDFEGNYSVMDKWWNEGFTEYLTSKIVRGTEMEYRFQLDLGKRPFIAYASFSLMKYIEEQLGVTKFDDLINTLLRIEAEDSVQYVSKMHQIFHEKHVDRLIHEFMVKLRNNEIVDNQDQVIPTVGYFDMDMSFSLLPELNYKDIGMLNSYTTKEFYMDIPEGYVLSIYPMENSEHVQHSIEYLEERVDYWNLPVVISGECDTVVPITIYLTYTGDSVMEAGSLYYELVPMEECINDPVTKACGSLFNFKVGDYWNYTSEVGGQLTISENTVSAIVNDSLGNQRVYVSVMVRDQIGTVIDQFKTSITCDGIYAVMDMSSLVSSIKSGLRKAKFIPKGKGLQIPTPLTVLDKLPKSQFAIEGEVFDGFSVEFNYELVDRVVKSKERIKTPMGELDCYKVVSRNNATMQKKPSTKGDLPAFISNIDLSSTVTQWYAEGFGMVKQVTESAMGGVSTTMMTEKGNKKEGTTKKGDKSPKGKKYPKKKRNLKERRGK